jgi:hypothetical protein
LSKTARLDTLSERWARLSPHIKVLRPDGNGPWPTLLMFHGCGGPRPYLDGYMRAAAEAGVMAVSVDSFTHRGIGRTRAIAAVCTGVELQGWKRAGDVLAAAWGRGPWTAPTGGWRWPAGATAAGRLWT